MFSILGNAPRFIYFEAYVKIERMWTLNTNSFRNKGGKPGSLSKEIKQSGNLDDLLGRVEWNTVYSR